MQMWIVAALVVLGLGTPVDAKPALRDVPEIDDALFAIGLADQIRRNCPTISARLFKAWVTLRDLEKDAKARGYSDAEINAHLDSEVEKNRLRARGQDLMNARGLDTTTQGYCLLGEQEIGRNSAAGVLLRSSQ